MVSEHPNHFSFFIKCCVFIEWRIEFNKSKAKVVLKYISSEEGTTSKKEKIFTWVGGWMGVLVKPE